MLKITPDQFAVIVEQGREGKPLEICGLLAGHQSTLNGESQTVVEIALPVESDDKSPLTYSINAQGYMKAVKEAERLGLEIIGIYHTHPATVPYPSKTDVARAHWGDSDDLLFPEFSYLIIGLADPQNPIARSYQIRGRRIPEDIAEESVVIEVP